MKKSILFLLFPIILFSQSEITEEYVSAENFSKIYNKYLTESILGDSDLSTMGSFVSVDIVKPKLNFAVSKNWFGGENDYLKASTTLKFDAGIKDGVSTIFKNEEYNTDINIRLDHNIVIGYKGFTRFKYFKDDKAKLDIEVSKLEERKNENEAYIKTLKERISNSNNKTSQEYYEMKMKVEELEKKDYQVKIDAKIDEARWTSVRLLWLNVFAKYGTQKLNIYDSNAMFKSQIEKITPENHELGFGLNLYYDQVRDLPNTYKNHWAYIFNGQYSIKYSYADTNNSSELSAEKVVNESVIGSDASNTRFIETVTNAFMVGKFDTFKRHQIAIDINKKIVDNLHLHVFGDYNEIEDSSKFNGNYKNLGLGLIIGLQKKSDTEKKTIVNFEVFTLFRDLDDRFESTGDEFYKRATVGIRTTIPFDNLLKRK